MRGYFLKKFRRYPLFLRYGENGQIQIKGEPVLWKMRFKQERETWTSL